MLALNTEVKKVQLARLPDYYYSSFCL